jgi:uncharacterized protein with HEPN domain
MKDDYLYLLHIKEAIEKIQNHLGANEVLFYEDDWTRDAVYRNLQTLSESTQKLSDEIKSKYPSIDWKGYSGLRNVLTHQYLGIKAKLVWKIIQEELPILLETVNTVMKNYS